MNVLKLVAGTTAVLLTVLVVSAQTKTETIELTEENSVVLRGPITDQMSGPLIAKVQAKAEKLGSKHPLYLVLDSPGGSISSGLDIIANLKTIPNLKTVTIFAASMASGIVNGLPGERLGTENSISMFHRAKGGLQGQFNDGEMESQLAFWKGIVTKMELQNSSRMGMTLEDYKKQVKDELWIHGNDNLVKKSLDKITSFKCTTSLIQKTETLSINTMFGTINLVFSACPLLNYPVAIKGGEEGRLLFVKAYKEISRNFSFGNRIQ